MTWARYDHVFPGADVTTCETCTIKNLKYSMDFYGDKYEETDLLTLQSTVALVDRLNAADIANGNGDPNDDKFRPELFEPEPGMQCRNCGMIAGERQSA
jgi:hypothetical protein